MEPPHHPPPLPRQAKPSSLAICSFVLGILSLVCCGTLLTGIPAAICGHKARSRIRNSGGSLTGKGLATAGLCTAYLGIALGLVALGLLASKAYRRHREDRAWPTPATCVDHLRILEGAKQQWALENRLPGSAVPTPADLDEYLRGGFQAVRCPQGGTYTLNAVDAPPTCSVPGHTLSP